MNDFVSDPTKQEFVDDGMEPVSRETFLYVDDPFEEFRGKENEDA